MTKTEVELLKLLATKKSSKTSVFGYRKVQAAKKLHEKGLAEFVNQSDTVRNCVRTRNGDYKSVFVYQGYLIKRL